MNIILCQFIYLPVFAVPAFNEITWTMGLDSSINITTPSFALLQNTNLSRRATLETNTTSIQQLCDLKESNPVFENLFCFNNPREFSYGGDNQQHVRYVTFNGSQFPNMSSATNLGLWYQYYSMLLAVQTPCKARD